MKSGALIITFNPDLEILKKNIDAISTQVEKVVIVDNASQNLISLSKLLCQDNLLLIKNISNLGIAKALNIGMEYFYENQFDWVITLDQDSICPSDIITKMNSYIEFKQVAIICPQIHYIGWESLHNDFKNEYEYVKACMTSASYTKVSTWKMVNGYNDDYFIDYVDNEFCMKLTINNFKILKINTIILDHNLGQCKEIKLFRMIPIRYCLHNPVRYYYMVRNMILFNSSYKEYLNYGKETLKVLYLIVSALIWEREKRKVLFYMLKGIKDAKNNKYGII